MHSRWLGRACIAVAWIALIVMSYQFIMFMRQSEEPQHLLETYNMYKDNDNPGLWYRLKPNYGLVYDGLMVRIPPTVILTNSQGFRDIERSLEKPEGTFRIVVLGDSMAFGFGVEQDEPFPAVLEELLNEQSDSLGYEVLNLAQPGYNTLGEMELFRVAGQQYNPNLVILQFMDNDWENRKRRRELFDKLREEGPPQNLDDRIEYEKQVSQQLVAEQDAMVFDEKWANVEGPLRELYRILDGTPLLIVSFSFDEQQEAALGRLAAEFNWTVLHIRLIYGYGPDEEEYREMIVHPQDNHPSRKAHHLVAERLLEEITSEGIR